MLPNTEGKAGFEERDVNLAAVLWMTVGVVVLLAVVFAGMYATLRLFEREAARPASPRAEVRVWPKEPPPEPHLQTRPWEDLARLRAEEDARLHRYVWVDRKAGIVRIPIERAIALLAERGLPARGLPPQREEAQ